MLSLLPAERPGYDRPHIRATPRAQAWVGVCSVSRHSKGEIVKHYGNKSHKVHVQRHFLLGRGYFVWCEIHGRLKPFHPIEGTACSFARAHLSGDKVSPATKRKG